MIERGILRVENLESSINDMVDRYIASIKGAIGQVPTKTVWIGGLHPQPVFTENINGWSPVTGSWEQRQLNSNLINKKAQNAVREGRIRVHGFL